ncbi:hypothetical protein [Neobacillus vireti]|uniref:Uncharacterized protein n=1 Tax=Neobacillus vireti LMG 21834 TaxID=1131730 RepID=A0AB94IPF4_9BACI|nr:hypothetical protein [Neobacillus vireti]ETI68940.1 hypothetical protein BAVI_09271 [Neobacillus vireti LMG 21834]KLT15757.1 hypothetical protein AA980_21275 [Neobacillus vireti]
MVWTLGGLFVISVLLLIISILKSTQVAKMEHNQIDVIHISTMKEINALQESIRNIELDIEVVMKEAGIQLSPEEKVFMREVLDLYKRNYSIESIAKQKQVEESEIEQRLAPFQKIKDEGRKVANEN